MTPSATATTDSAVADRPSTATAPEPADAPARKRKVAPYLVDCDCHHAWRQIDDIFPYLPRRYVESIKDFGPMLPKYPYTNMRNNSGLAFRVDHTIESDTDLAQFTVDHHVEAYGIDAALLTGSSVYSAAGLPDLDYAAALCRAFNDYTLEHWVAKDPRLLMTIAVPVHAPVEAAAEIERIGSHPSAAAVMMPAGARSPFGNRFYDPIHAAAAEQGLPIVTHFGCEGQGPTNAPTAAGFPSYYLEMRMARPQIAQAHSASLICEGVFERYPTPEVAVRGGGHLVDPRSAVAFRRRLEGHARIHAVGEAPAERILSRAHPRRHPAAAAPPGQAGRGRVPEMDARRRRAGIRQ